MRDSWELKRVPIRSCKQLPRLRHPAGYVCLIRDMDYGNRYKIEETTHPATHLDDVLASLPFKTKIAYIAKTSDAKAAAHYLRQRYARRSDQDAWFDLNDAQLREIRRLTSPAQRDAGDWQKVAAFDSEEPLPAAYRSEQSPVSLKDLISNSYQTSPPLPASAPRQSQAAAAEAAGCNRGCLYFFIGIIVLAAAFGAHLTNSRPSDSSANQSNTSRGVSSLANRSAARPTSTSQPPATDANTSTVTDMPTSTKRPTSTSQPPATDANTSTVTDMPTSTKRPTSSHTPTLTAEPTASSAAVAAMYVRTRGNKSARVRSCPGTACGIIGGLSPGAKVRSLGRVEGETVDGSSAWIQFRHGGEVAYIHSSLVSSSPPNQ